MMLICNRSKWIEMVMSQNEVSFFSPESRHFGTKKGHLILRHTQMVMCTT